MGLKSEMTKMHKKVLNEDESVLTKSSLESPNGSLTEKLSLQDQYMLRKKNANLLASHYTKSKRAMEIASLTCFTLFLILSIVNLSRNIVSIQKDGVTIASAIILSIILADIFSGLVHWGADTWGNVDTPVVGKTFVRSFREHHVDPMQITVHDTIETNGDNCLLTVPALAVLSFIKITPETSLFAISFIISLAVWVALTNQFHKWAHMIKPPKLVSFLQTCYIVLSRKEHQVHHKNPFDRYYCITTGWCNAVLGSISFWKRMEVIIGKTTGMIPRQDDAFWTMQ